LRVRFRGDVTATFACASASCARDRLVAPNQSTHPKHYELDPQLTTGSACRDAITPALVPAYGASTSSAERLS